MKQKLNPQNLNSYELAEFRTVKKNILISVQGITFFHGPNCGVCNNKLVDFVWFCMPQNMTYKSGRSFVKLALHIDNTDWSCHYCVFHMSARQNLRHFGTVTPGLRTLILDTIMKLSGTIGVTQKTMTLDTHVRLILLQTLNPQERWGTHKNILWGKMISSQKALTKVDGNLWSGLCLHTYL